MNMTGGNTGYIKDKKNRIDTPHPILAITKMIYLFQIKLPIM